MATASCGLAAPVHSAVFCDLRLQSPGCLGVTPPQRNSELEDLIPVGPKSSRRVTGQETLHARGEWRPRVNEPSPLQPRSPCTKLVPAAGQTAAKPRKENQASWMRMSWKYSCARTLSFLRVETALWPMAGGGLGGRHQWPAVDSMLIFTRTSGQVAAGPPRVRRPHGGTVVVRFRHTLHCPSLLSKDRSWP